MAVRFPCIVLYTCSIAIPHMYQNLSCLRERENRCTAFQKIWDHVSGKNSGLVHEYKGMM